MTLEELKQLLDWGAFSVLAAWFMDALPAVATLLTCIWWIIRIAETDTTKRLWSRLRRRG